jgi:hypothetical protein
VPFQIQTSFFRSGTKGLQWLHHFNDKAALLAAIRRKRADIVCIRRQEQLL